MDTQGKLKSYKDLLVWQKSMALVKDIYRVTRGFPQDERFGGRFRPIQYRRSRVTLVESSYSSFRTRKDLCPSWRHKF